MITALILLAAGALVSIQHPAVQNLITQRLVRELEGSFKGSLHIGSFQTEPVNTIILSDIVLTDEAPLQDCFFPPVDTIAHIGSLTLRYNLSDILRKSAPYRFRKAEIRNATLSLVVEDLNANTNRNNIMRVFSLVPKNRPPQKWGDILEIRETVIRNFNFHLLNSNSQPHGVTGSMDWADLDLTVNAVARGLSVKDGYVSLTVPELDLREKSGYSADNIHASVRVGMGKVEITDFHLSDPWSDLNIPQYRMSFYNAISFRTFADSVRLDVGLAPSKLDFKTVGSFAHPLHELGLDLDVKGGSFEGTVFDWSIRNLDIHDRSGVDALLSADVSGLKDPSTMTARLEIANLEATTAQIDSLIAELPVELDADIRQYAPGVPLTFSGEVGGSMGDLLMSGRFSSPVGTLSTAGLNLKGLGSEGPLRIKGPLQSTDLDLGAILGEDVVRECSMTAGAQITIDKDNIAARLDSMRVSRLNVRGYDYSAIAAAGSFEDGAFNGKVICSDPNLNFIFQGIVNLAKGTPNAIYKFYFNLGYADLVALGLDQREVSKLSLSVNANYMRIARGDVIGDVIVKNINVENRDGRRDLEDISIASHSNDNINRINLSSSFLNASYVGTRPFGEMLSDLEGITLKREMPALYKDNTYVWKANDYRVNVQFHDSREFFSYAFPGLYIADGTTLTAGIDRSGLLQAQIQSPRIAFKEKYLKDLSVKVDNRSHALHGTIQGKELSTGGLAWKDNALALSAANDSLTVSLRFGDTRLGELDRGELSLAGRLSRDYDQALSLTGLLKPSFLIHNTQLWNIAPAQFHARSDRMGVRNLDIYNAGQHLRLDGNYSTSSVDTLSIGIENLDLQKLEQLLGTNLELSGTAAGSGKIFSPLSKNLGVFMDIKADSCHISGSDAGAILLSTAWNTAEDALDFSLWNELNRLSTINARGSYNPSDQSIKARLLLSNMDLSYLSRFMTGVADEMSGGISGEFSCTGTPGDMSVYGRGCRLDGARMLISPTNVAYTLDGGFHIDEGGLYFDELAVRDEREGRGRIHGAILFDRLKDFRMDTGIDFERLHIFNAPQNGSESIYGDVSASGTLSLSGPIEALRVQVDAATDGEGSFCIPLGGFISNTGTNLLTFKDHTPPVTDPYEEMMSSLRQRREKRSGGIQIHADVDVDDGTECTLEVDRNSGNVMKGRGAGAIAIDLVPAQNLFNINGDYTLSSGKYHFAALGITQKDFEIQNGSSIKFEGDILSSLLDIDAIYSTKTSISTLIADTTSVSTRRVVECGIHISDKLSNPQLSFSINVPDLDPTTKSLVESALSTEDKIQKQFLSLLVANSFIPDEQSGIVNNNSLLYSNVASIMAGQLNNILQQLEIPLDLGLSYQPTESGTNIFDVAVSTQLFNNRVVVNGAIGNRQYTGTAGDELVGDLDIEVKLNRSGNFRGTLFSHSADQYTNYLENSQRNGVGLAYQKEFNSFKEFFRTIFSPRSDAPEEESEKKVIIIE